MSATETQQKPGGGTILMAFLPLVVFYIIDDQLGPTAGIIAAIVLTLGEVAWHKWRYGKVDRFVWLTGGLVVGLGSVSLISGDERFVLYSPALGDVIFAVLLLLTVWRKMPLLVELAKRTDASLEKDPERQQVLAGMTWRLAILLLLHGVAVWWSAGESRETWLFVSGPLQYIMMAVWFVGEVLFARYVTLSPEPPEGESPSE
ncbi:MAG: inner membrane-spanning protein YciB [Bradymonadia bacterium]